MKWFSTYIHTKFLSVTGLTLNIDAWHSSKQYRLRVKQLQTTFKTDGFVLFRETIILSSENHTKQRNTFSWKTAEPLFVAA